MRALDRKLVRDTWHMRGQVVSIALVLASGVAALLALMGTYRSLSASRDAFYEGYAFPDAFVSLERAPESIVARLREIPGVASLETRLVERASFLIPGMIRPAAGRAISLPEAHGDREHALRLLVLRRGRLPDAGHPDEALVLESFADEHGLDPGDHLEVVIEGKRLRLAIAGLALSPEWVFPAEAGTVDYKSFGVVWLGRDALAAVSGKVGAFDSVTFRLTPGITSTPVLAAIDRVLARWGGLGAIDRERQTSHVLLRGELEQLQVLATEVPFVFLLVAAFLLNVALNRIVHLQREQLAVLRALGYSRLDVGRHMLAFASVVITLGAALGVVLGRLLGDMMIGVYAPYFRFPVLDFTLDGDLVAWGLVTTAGAAVLGALTAVWRAARLAPAEAMRPPAPVRYRRGLLSRLGLARLVGPMGRMIVRELERRPGALIVSVTGIAFASALVILGRFGLDSFETMLDVTFARAVREDVMVVLARPAPRGELNWFRHMPGVMAAEPLRMVPVRLVAENRHFDTSLTGLAAGGRLRQIIDGLERPVPVPSDGLLLGRVLGERLGVVAGDRVRVERKDGDRRALELPVVGLVDDTMGMNAYVDLDALSRALGEEPMLSVVLLEVEHPARDALLRALTDIPSVIMVSEQAAIREAVDAQTGDVMTTFTLIVVLFGVVIAVGVIYNNARIALSERGRDLATLRVLGYTRREISIVLLGQLAIHTLLALPVGFAFGYGLADLMMSSINPEQFRALTIIDPDTYAFASLVVIGSSFATALVIRRRLDAIDLVGALKARD
ncbi:MAG: ABC transporter permease [Deltaproteobacteria bacterium]|nr:ABC transporter permease [Deltaproteobacteria bacterium]